MRILTLLCFTLLVGSNSWAQTNRSEHLRSIYDQVGHTEIYNFTQDDDLVLCVNDGGVKTCPLNIDGVTSYISIGNSAVDGNSAPQLQVQGSSYAGILLYDTDAPIQKGFRIVSNSDYLLFQTTIDNGNGDETFASYNETSGGFKFHYNLGVGTFPSYRFHVDTGRASDFIAKIRNSSTEIASSGLMIQTANNTSSTTVLSAKNSSSNLFTVLADGDVFVDNGDLEVSSGNVIVPVGNAILNSGYVDVNMGSSTTLDSKISFRNNYATWAVGLDNNDSDKFVIGRSLTLGTNADLQIDTGGNVSILTGNLYANSFLLNSDTDSGLAYSSSTLVLKYGDVSRVYIDADTFGVGADPGATEFYLYKNQDAYTDFTIRNDNTGSTSNVMLKLSTESSSSRAPMIKLEGTNDSVYLSINKDTNNFVVYNGLYDVFSINIVTGDTRLGPKPGSIVRAGSGNGVTNATLGGYSNTNGQYALESYGNTDGYGFKAYLNRTDSRSVMTASSLTGTLFTVEANGSVRASYLDATSVAGLPLHLSGSEIVKYTSSERFKTNIRDIEFDTSRIFDLRPVTFDALNNSGKNITGLIAEEVDLIIPELISYDEEGLPEGWASEPLVVMILNELKKLRIEFDAFKESVEVLK